MNTKAPVPPPPKKQKPLTQRLQVSAPMPTLVPDNLATPTSGTMDLNFKVHPDFHREFKSTAAIRGMSMKELLEASFNAWKEKFGAVNQIQQPQARPIQVDIFKG